MARGRKPAVNEVEPELELEPVVVEDEEVTEDDIENAIDAVVAMLEATPGGENIARHVLRLLRP
jgi:hypothetical protein